MRDKTASITEVKSLIQAFAEKRLSKEEESLCLHIWEKLARKRSIDVTRTRASIWAAAAIWSFCRANFKLEEGIGLDLICQFFDAKKSTVGNKASEICRMLKIDFFNPEYTTAYIQGQNPLNKMTTTEDGLIVPIDMLRGMAGWETAGQISADTVESTWRRMAEMSPREAEKMAKVMSKQQPVLTEYLLTVDDDLLNEDERQLLFYLGTVVWQIMSQGPTPAPEITEGDLDKAIDKGGKLLDHPENTDAVFRMMSTYEEPEVLGFIIEAMEEDEEEEGVNIREETRGLIVIQLKAELDAFIEAMSRRRQGP